MNEEQLKHVADLIRKFLMDNGGFENGLDTYMDTVFTKDSNSSFDWNTPAAEELTGKQKRVISSKFAKIMGEYLAGQGITGKVIVTAVPQEYGAFDTHVAYRTQPKRVSLWR